MTRFVPRVPGFRCFLIATCVVVASAGPVWADPGGRGGDGAGRRGPPPHGDDAGGIPHGGDRQRMREQLREQLRHDRAFPGQGPPGGGQEGGSSRLSPEERQALREQLRDQRRGRGF